MTFAAMSIPFLLIAAGVFAVGARAARRDGELSSFIRSWGATTLTLFLLTLVFDNLMIAAGFFSYGGDHITGIRIVLMPIEDLLYPLVASLFLAGFLRLTSKRISRG